jgi:hypothetical protein
MGLFDTVVIEGLKLKQPPELKSYLRQHNATVSNDFQTKDLDNTLSTYYVKEDGQFYETIMVETGKQVRWEPLRFPNHQPWLEKMFNKILLSKYLNEYSYDYKKESGSNLHPERVPKIVKSNITQTIAIYEYREIGGRYVELEYELKIIDGKVKSHKLLQFTLEDEKEAQQRKEKGAQLDAEWDLKRAQRQAFQAKWYYPVFREVVNPLIYLAGALTRKLADKISSNTHRWHRF